MDKKMIAVTGATGQQGSAVARRLLAQGWPVRALTRDASKPAAQALRAAGAEIVPGNLDSRAELDAAFQGAYGVFSVQNFWLPNVGFEGEVRQGKNVADAAKAAGVQHLVYSSVGAAHRGMGQKHFDSKWLIEQHVHALGVPFTILRPVAFMENYNWSRPQILSGQFQGWGLRPDKGLQLIAVDDVAVFVELAFAHPDEFLGRTVELAGDELTESEIIATLANVIGRPVQAAAPQGNGGAPSEEQLAMFNFFNGVGYDADIAALRARHPGMLTLEQWLRRTGWENAEPVPIPETGNWG